MQKSYRIARDLRGGGPLRSLNLPSTFPRSPTCKNEIFEGGSERQIKRSQMGQLLLHNKGVLLWGWRGGGDSLTKEKPTKMGGKRMRESVIGKFLVVFSS